MSVVGCTECGVRADSVVVADLIKGAILAHLSAENSLVCRIDEDFQHVVPAPHDAVKVACGEVCTSQMFDDFGDRHEIETS